MRTFPILSQRRQRQHIAKVCFRSLQTISIVAFLTVQSPLIIMMGLLVAAWTTGVTQAQGAAVVDVACVIAKATYVYAPLCGGF